MGHQNGVARSSKAAKEEWGSEIILWSRGARASI